MKFRGLDRLTAWEAWRTAVGRKAVSFEEYCLRQGLGEPERLPESLVLQAAFDLANWLVMLSSDYRLAGRPIGAEQVCFHRFLGPGQAMTVAVAVRERAADRLIFDAVGRDGSREIFHCEAGEMELLPLPDLEDPDDRRTLFSEIFHPEGEAGACPAPRIQPGSSRATTGEGSGRRTTSPLPEDRSP
ncbi:MAG: hypothetical protein OZSIB_2513 [Candidatus Ozemobacter sibiricus]|jgi:hypothetical protein|uniref:Uncharacterized protein n=1 Tax=Candidatus Ozemobacter sibiricus TaxID=2268124 RepID=A0A367ZSX0_9BACT|nr:MAG: hypothetical protein OZSIB_2513 [Candidatus Ozemobacter sibiricus]